MQDWKAWERQLVDETYPLRQYLADGVFLTEFGEPEPCKAAIKIVPGNPDDTASQLERWKLASGLSHPHLLRIFTMGRSELDGVPFIYLVTEYAEENLAQVSPDRPLTADEAREMMEPALSALAYIHNQGFVHGRLKPANIMAVDGRLRISSSALCRVGECAPAPPDAYSPPQTEGPSPAGDVWSLGITLVEALTQRVHASEQREVHVPGTLPAPFFEVARGCLESDPSRRWTVADIAARLRPGAPAVPERKADKTDAPSRKRRYRLAALLGLALVPIVISALVINYQSSAPPSVPPQQSAVQPKPEPRVESPPPAPHAPEPVAKTAPTAPPSANRPERPPTNAADGEVVQRVMPDVTLQAIQTIHGKVKVGVRVHVDSSGNVSGAEFDSQGPSKYFAQSALTAARRWRFTPSSGDWILRFEFSRTGPQVSAVRTAPK